MNTWAWSGSDALGDRRNTRFLVADFPVIAQLGNAKPVKIGTVDRDRLWRRQIGETAFDQIPRLQPARRGADEKDRGLRLPVRFAPIREADQHRRDVRDAGNGQCPKSFAALQQGRGLKALGVGRRNPEVSRRMVDHGRDHALETQEQPELNGEQHDREHDPDERRDQPDPVVKQVTGRKRENDGRQPTEFHLCPLSANARSTGPSLQKQQHSWPVCKHPIARSWK
jgi:hypothetical protein